MGPCIFLQVDTGDKTESVIVFFKIKPDVITPDNLHSNIFVSSMLDSPVTALYHAVQKVFVPVLLKGESIWVIQVMITNIISV